MKPAKKHITIHDIARELGISASTVSRALNDNPRISRATREAVRKLAAENGYRPNAVASGLRKGKSNTVGVIIPNINRSFFSNVIGGMEEELSKLGVNLMICQTHESLDKERAAISTLLDARVDGLMLSLSMESTRYDHIRDLLEGNIQVIFFDRIPRGLDVTSVVINDYDAAYTLTKHLIESGYRRPAHVAGNSGISVYDDRRRGFSDALKETGIRIPEGFIIESDMKRGGGAEAFRQLYAHQEPPDAIICAGDFSAHGVLLEAQKHGLNVPGDIAISGFANEEFTPHIVPPLTSVDQRGYDIGKAAAGLFAEGYGSGKARQVVMEPEIIFRESTQAKKHIENLKT